MIMMIDHPYFRFFSFLASWRKMCWYYSSRVVCSVWFMLQGISSPYWFSFDKYVSGTLFWYREATKTETSSCIWPLYLLWFHGLSWIFACMSLQGLLSIPEKTWELAFLACIPDEKNYVDPLLPRMKRWGWAISACILNERKTDR